MIKLLSSKIVYSGRIFDIRKDRISEDDTEYDREIVTHNGSVVIVAVFPDQTVALVRQYRHAVGKFLLELPAGSLDSENETPESGAKRELEEEIGVTAEKMELLAEFYVSPGFLTEKMSVFLATGLVEVGQNLDPDEVLTVERYPLNQTASMISSGEIEDAKTIIGLLFARERLAGTDY